MEDSFPENISSGTHRLSIVQKLTETVQRLQISVDHFQARRSTVVAYSDDFGSEWDKKSVVGRALEKYVKEHAIKVLGLNDKVIESEWTLLASELFASSSDIRPSEWELRIDWDEKGLTPWTKHIAVIFAARFLQEHRLGSFPLLQDSVEPGEVVQAFLKAIHELKGVYHRTHSAKRHRRETRWDTSHRSRSRSRRVQLLNTRKRRLKGAHLSGDALEILMLLGEGGMSSEDSEGVPGCPDRRYFVKQLPWRAPSLTAWLHQIDSLPLIYARHYFSRTYQERARIPSQLLSTNCQPPSGLPVSFYCEEWLASRSEWVLAKLRIMGQRLLLPTISL